MTTWSAHFRYARIYHVLSGYTTSTQYSKEAEQKRLEDWYRIPVSVSVVGLPWTSEPERLINSFCGEPYTYDKPAFDLRMGTVELMRPLIIDEKCVYLTIIDNSRDIGYPPKIEHTFSRVGLILLYDVTCGSSIGEAMSI